MSSMFFWYDWAFRSEHFHIYYMTGIETVVGHQTLSDRKCYLFSTHVSKQDILSCTLLSIICRKSFKMCLAELVAYYKSIIKSIYTFIQQTTKQEHSRCRQLPLFTFTLNSGNTWSFYLLKVFLKNIKSTCMMPVLLNCFMFLNKIFLTRKCLSSLLFIKYVDVFKFTFLFWGPSIAYA